MNKLIYLLVLPLLLTSCGRLTTSSNPEDEMTYEERLYLHVTDWGLGTNITTYLSNDHDYEWYVDQHETGTYWDVNCGPTSIEMAGRFSREDFPYTAIDARAAYRPDGGWWYDSDISSALTHFEIPHTSSQIGSSADLITLLNTGGVILVNPDMSWINMETDENHHTGLFYTPGTGHYLIVKGYVIVDGFTYFEVYDPWSVTLSYSNGNLKGKNRYYDEDSFLDSLLNWWTTVYTITQVTT